MLCCLKKKRLSISDNDSIIDEINKLNDIDNNTPKGNNPKGNTPKGNTPKDKDNDPISNDKIYKIPSSFNDLNKQKKYLSQIKYDDISYLSLKGYESFAKCVRITDGDTCSLVFFVNGYPQKYKCRLSHIDTAELSSTNAHEASVALKAKNRLTELIYDKIIYIKCNEWDKYGRLLVDVYLNDSNNAISVNKLLINEGLAYEYNGSKKKDFAEWYKLFF